MLGALEIPLGFGVGHGFLLAPHHEPEAQELMMGMFVRAVQRQTTDES